MNTFKTFSIFITFIYVLWGLWDPNISKVVFLYRPFEACYQDDILFIISFHKIRKVMTNQSDA